MDLEVVGRHALFFDDDAMAAFVNSTDALVEWNSLKIDRYDVRHLLSAPPPQPRRSLPSLSNAIDSSLKSELDLERYLDLPPPSDEPEEEEEEEGANSVNTSGYHAIPFSYRNSNDCAEQAGSATGFENFGFRPSFNVPENLLQCLPPSEKVHQIIARTAQFVSRNGGQSEIVLRVKQGDNPTFGFLMPDHHLHPYYRFLVDHQELLNSNSDGKPQNEERKDANEPDGALSLLGSVYGSGEDEDALIEDVSNKMASNEAVDAVAYNAQEKGESSANVPRQDEIISKHLPPPGSLDKEKSHLLKKNPLISGSKNGSTNRKKLKDDSISASVSAALEKIKASGLGTTFKIEPVVLEPPSDLKNLIGKIVEFIMKNGKQFEATLIEQDSKHGRFPFLLPSNMYHPYYLKVLHAAQESKVSGKSLYSGNDDSTGQGLEKRASLSKEGGFLSFGSGEGDVPYEFDKKEKFKMVIGKSKKESQEPLDKVPQQEHGFNVDAAAAAAILQAAARGIKNPNLGILSKAAGNANSQGHTTDCSLGTITSSGPDNMTAGSRAIAKSNAEADSSETHLSKEQKLKAERLKKAKMFVAMLKNGAAPLKSAPSRGVSLEPQESGLSGSGTELSFRGEQREGSTAPLDGDMSDQGRRLKSGDEYNERRSMRKYRSRSGRHEEDEDDEGERKQQSTRKEHYSSMKNEGEESEDEKDHKRSKKKNHRSHYSDEDEASDKCEEERGHRHSRKKHHRSRYSDEDEASDKCEEERGHRHSRKKHHRSHYTDEDEASDKYEEERGHRHSRKKHRSHRTSDKYDDDEENHRHSRKKHKSHRSHHSSHHRSRHERLKGASSDDEQHQHKSNKHRKGTAEREDLEEGEISGKVSDQSRGSLGATISREASQDISSPRQRAPSQPSEPTQPSDDLRAKIRAMLMETRR